MSKEIPNDTPEESESLLIDNNHYNFALMKVDSAKQDNFNLQVDKLKLERHHLSKEERRRQKLNSNLLTSIVGGDDEQFHEYYQSGASINATCRSSKLTACHYAVLFDRCNLLKKLVDNGADLSLCEKNYCSPLHLAAWKGCMECMKILLQRQPDDILLPVTTPEPALKIVNWDNLDSWDHNHNLKDTEIPFIAEGSTALHIACRQLHVKCVEYLLEQGADTEALDCYGRVALDMVMKTVETIYQNRNNNVERFKSQRDFHASRETLEEFDQRVTCVDKLNYEKISELIIFFLVNHAATFKVFQSTSEAENIDRKATYLLHAAVIMQNERLLKFILNRNVDLKVCMSTGETPLHLAVRCAYANILDVLIETDKTKSTFEIKDSEGKTALLIAVDESWNYGVNSLLVAGAQVTAITDQGDNILHLAARTNHVDLVEELSTFPEISQVLNYKNLMGETPLMVAVLQGHLQCVQLLLAIGADGYLYNENSKTILHMAAEKGHTEVLRFLLARDSSMLNTPTRSGETALHLATMTGHVECMKLLLSSGSLTKINSAHIFGNASSSSSSVSLTKSIAFSGTPLHYAVMDGRMDLVKCLIEHDNSLIHVINDAGWCPLHTAVHFNQLQCIKYILQQGGNLSNVVHYFDGSVVSVVEQISLRLDDPVSFLKSIWDSRIEITSKNSHQITNSVSLDFSMLTSSFKRRDDMDVVNAIAKCTHVDLRNEILVHPVTRAFLDFTWKRMESFLLALCILMQLLFAIALNTFGVAVSYAYSPSRISAPLYFTITFGVLAFLVMNEIYLTICQRRAHVKTSRNWSTRLSYTITFIVCIWALVDNYSSLYASDNWKHDRMWKYFLPVPIIISWMQALSTLSMVPTFDRYVLLFRRLLLIVVKSLCPAIFVAVGVSVLHEMVVSDFGSEKWASVLNWKLLMNATLTMIDYRYQSNLPMFTEKPGDNIFYASLTAATMSVFSMACILMAICMSVHEFKYLRKYGQSMILIQKIEFLTTLQYYLHDDKLINWLPRKLKRKLKERKNASNSIVIPFQKFKVYTKNTHFDHLYIILLLLFFFNSLQ